MVLSSIGKSSQNLDAIQDLNQIADQKKDIGQIRSGEIGDLNTLGDNLDSDNLDQIEKFINDNNPKEQLSGEHNTEQLFGADVVSSDKVSRKLSQVTYKQNRTSLLRAKALKKKMWGAQDQGNSGAL